MKNDTGNKEQPQKHDQGYKRILSIKENFLHFLQKYINVPWITGVTVDDIEQINTAFVERDYRLIDSDVIYKVKMGDAEVYFYVLLELQSQVDFTMPYRFLRYMSEFLNDIFKNTDEEARKRKTFKLPAIVPIVLYNGGDKWTAAGSYREYTENHEVFGDNIINFRYLLFDLNRISEERILSTKELLDIVFTLDKRRLTIADLKEIVKPLPELVPELAEDALTELCRWVIHVLCKSDITPDLEKNLKKSFQKGEEKNMKYALDVWMEEKEEQWVEKGKKKGKVEIAKAMKTKGMDVDTIAEITGLTVDDVLRLD